MNKLLTSIAALSIASMSFSAVNSEIRLGVVANMAADYGVAEETLKDSGRKTEEHAVLAHSFASIFAEISIEQAMGLTFGVEYAAETIDLEKETRGIRAEGGADAGADSGNQVIDAEGNPEVALAIQNFFLDEDFDSFGGNILTTASLELLFPLPFIPNKNQVRSAFFIDAGNVFSSTCSDRQKLLQNCTDFDLGEMRYSAGVSVTYLSPFGPLTFYLAQPFGQDRLAEIRYI